MRGRRLLVWVFLNFRNVPSGPLLKVILQTCRKESPLFALVSLHQNPKLVYRAERVRLAQNLSLEAGHPLTLAEGHQPEAIIGRIFKERSLVVVSAKLHVSVCVRRERKTLGIRLRELVPESVCG